MQPTKYIGITDFTDSHQVRDMLGVMKRAYQSRQIPASRKLMVGVMMSFKTLRGLPSRWSEIFPPREKVSEIFSSDEVFNCLHYADYSRETAWNEVQDAIGYAGIGVHALQLDMVWPDPVIISNALYVSRKRLEVILQVNRVALLEARDDPEEVVEFLRDYEGIISHALFDKSGGEGKAMEADTLRPFLDMVQEKLPWLGLAVAGGLGPGRLELLGDLPARFPDLSIDAQGQLRPSGDSRDRIDWNMAAQYLREAVDKLQ